MGRRHHPEVASQRIVNRRLLLEDVHGGAGQPAVLQYCQQRGLVHQTAAGGVDEDRRPLHLPEPLAIHHPLVVRRQRHVQRHEIALAQEGVEVHQRDAAFEPLKTRPP